MAVRRGVHRLLEAEADRLIAESLRGVTSRTAKKDILTPWKQKDRLRREVYVTSGTPDGALRSGNFNRVANSASPHLNSRDGRMPARRVPIEGTLGAFVEDNSIGEVG